MRMQRPRPSTCTFLHNKVTLPAPSLVRRRAQFKSYTTEAKLHMWEVHTVINVFLEICWDKRSRHFFA